MEVNPNLSSPYIANSFNVDHATSHRRHATRTMGAQKMPRVRGHIVSSDWPDRLDTIR